MQNAQEDPHVNCLVFLALVKHLISSLVNTLQ